MLDQQTWRKTAGACLVVWLLLAGGCSTLREHEVTPPAQLAVFAKAGPEKVQVDMDKLARAKLPSGSYRVVLEDVLLIQMPQVMRAVTERFDDLNPELFRVAKDGAGG